MKIYNIIFYFLIFDLISSLKCEDYCQKKKFKNCELVQCSRQFCLNSGKYCKIIVTWTKFVGKSKVTYLSGEKYKSFQNFTKNIKECHSKNKASNEICIKKKNCDQNKWAKINRLSRNGLAEAAKMCACTGVQSYDCRNGFCAKNKHFCDLSSKYESFLKQIDNCD
jgi:hypothetical protein